jgi:hypothetical protein
MEGGGIEGGGIEGGGIEGGGIEDGGPIGFGSLNTGTLGRLGFNAPAPDSFLSSLLFTSPWFVPISLLGTTVSASAAPP